MDEPIVFWPTAHDEANLALLASAGFDVEAAIRAALDNFAAEITPALWALSSASPR